MTFEVGQEVWLIKLKDKISNVKCEECDGTGKALTTRGKEVKCPDCKGYKKVVKSVTEISIEKRIVTSCCQVLFGTLFDFYTLGDEHKIYVDDENHEACVNYISNLEYMYNADYNSISVVEENIESLSYVFATKKDASDYVKTKLKIK